MRSKLKDPANKEVRPNVTTYTIGKASNKGLMTAPEWSMTGRGAGIPKAPQQPGPGEYAQPSTLYGSHPMIPVAGRVPKSTQDRPDPNANFPDTPAPHDYEVVKPGEFGSVVQSKAPKWTMRSKLKDPANKEVRPNVTTYTIGKASNKGLMTMPEWSMTGRGTGIPKAPQQPGPGEYAQPSTLYGSHPMIPVAGRVPKSTCPRPEPSGNAPDTPAPHDYETVNGFKASVDM